MIRFFNSVVANKGARDSPGYLKIREGVVNKGESFLFTEGAWQDWADLVEQIHRAAALQGQDFSDFDNFGIKAYGDPAPAPKVAAPNLAGMTEADALAALEEVGLVGAAGTAEYSETVEAGRVISQDVAAGTEIAEGSTVTYVLSLGKAPAEKVIVPNLTNLTEADALASLKDVGLKGAAGTAEYSDTVKAGCVIRQDVAAGTKVDQGSTVTYILSLGKKTSGGGDSTDTDTGKGSKTLIKTGDPLVPVAGILVGVGVIAAGATVLVARRKINK